MERNLRKSRTGIVTSNKMNKSITVVVARKEKQETRPLSKLKRWRLVEILERAK